MDFRNGSASIPWVTHVFGIDVGHDCASVPCVAYVIGLDFRNGSVSIPWVAHVFGIDVGHDCASVPCK